MGHFWRPDRKGPGHFHLVLLACALREAIDSARNTMTLRSPCHGQAPPRHVESLCKQPAQAPFTGVKKPSWTFKPQQMPPEQRNLALSQEQGSSWWPLPGHLQSLEPSQLRSQLGLPYFLNTILSIIKMIVKLVGLGEVCSIAIYKWNSSERQQTMYN